MAVNAKAVVSVDVDDKAFKDFTREFEKYSKLLGKTPAAWSSMSKEQRAMTASFNQGISALMAQNEVMRKMAIHAKDVNHHFGHSLKHIRHMGHAITHIGHGVVHITEKLMKWAGIAAGIATGTGVAGFFGLESLGRWVRQGNVSSGRLGMGSGSLRALKNELGENYGMNVEAIARAGATAAEDRASPEAQLYERLGLDPTKLKGHHRVTALLTRMRQHMKETGLDPARYAQQYGTSVLGITGDDLRMPQDASDAKWDYDMKHIDKSAIALSIDKKSEAVWKSFLHSLEESTQKIQTIFATALTPILNSITANADGWIKELDKFMKSEGMTQFIAEIPKHMQTLWSALKAAGDALMAFAKLMGWVERSADEKLAARRRVFPVPGDNLKESLGGSAEMPIPGQNDAPGEGFIDRRLRQGPANPTGPRFYNEGGTGGIGSYQTGTGMEGVPNTGTYTLHKGEIVLPRNQVEILRGSGMADWKRAITGIESGGNYGIVNRYSGASGKYQVMPGNIGAWTKKALGTPMTQAEFLRSPSAQEKVFETIFQEYVNRFGNPVDAASAWFSGGPLTGNRAGPDAMGTSVSGYIQKFIRAVTGSGASGHMNLNINDNTGGNVGLSLTNMANTGPLPAFPI